MTTVTRWDTQSLFDDQVHDSYNFNLSDNLLNFVSAALSGLSIIFVIDIFFRLVVRSRPARVSSFAVYRRWLLARCTNPIEALSALLSPRRTHPFRKDALFLHPHPGASAQFNNPALSVGTAMSAPSQQHQQLPPGAAEHSTGSSEELGDYAAPLPHGAHLEKVRLDDVDSSDFNPYLPTAAPTAAAAAVAARAAPQPPGATAAKQPRGFPLWQTVGIGALGALLVALELLLILAATNRSAPVAINRSAVPSFAFRDAGGRREVLPAWKPCIVHPLVSKHGFTSQASFFLCAYTISAVFNRSGMEAIAQQQQQIGPRGGVVPARLLRTQTRAARRGGQGLGTGLQDGARRSGQSEGLGAERNAVVRQEVCSDKLTKARVRVVVTQADIFFNIETPFYLTQSQHYTAIALQNGTIYQAAVKVAGEDAIRVLNATMERYGMKVCSKRARASNRSWRYTLTFDFSGATELAGIPARNDSSVGVIRIRSNAWNDHILSIFRGALQVDGRTPAFKMGGNSTAGPFLDAVEEPLITLQRPWLSIVGGLSIMFSVLVVWLLVAIILGWGSGIDERMSWMFVFRSMNSVRDFRGKPDEIFLLKTIQ